MPDPGLTRVVEGQSLPPTICSHDAPNQAVVAEAGRTVYCRKCGTALSLEARAINEATGIHAPIGIDPTTPTATSTGTLAQYPGHGPA